jgi:uncharacterized protein YndB with AHSA1/START domain
MASQLRAEGLDFLDRAPIQIAATTTIAATPSAVWPAIADVDAWTGWCAGMKVARATSAGPFGEGSTRYVEVKGLKADETVLAFEVEQRFAFRLDGANLPALAAMVEELTLVATGGTTTVTYRQAVELRPWARLLAPVLRRQLATSVRSNLIGLDAWVLSHATSD